MNQKSCSLGIKKYKKTKEFDSIITNWVIGNPPMNLTKAEYFQKFLDAGMCKISMNQLSTIMLGLGYETDRSCHPPKWRGLGVGTHVTGSGVCDVADGTW